MLNAVVIYESKHGSTRQYAQWIAEDLQCRFIDRKAVDINDVKSADVVVYGGAVYAGGVSGVSFLRKNFDVLKSKHLIVFTCGLSNPADNHNTHPIRERLAKALTPQVMEELKVFHLRGAIDYRRLNMVHKTMMAMVVRPVKKKDPASRTAEEQQMIDTYGKSVSFVDRDSIAPLVDYARSL